MLSWLMNLDFAGGDGAVTSTTTVYHKKRGGSGRQWVPITFLLGVLSGR